MVAQKPKTVSISQLARMLLPSKATLQSVERHFSTAGALLNKRTNEGANLINF